MKEVTKSKIAFISRIVNQGTKEASRKAIFIPKDVVDAGLPRTRQVKVRIEEFVVE